MGNKTIKDTKIKETPKSKRKNTSSIKANSVQEYEEMLMQVIKDEFGIED